jgi:hypothetical protein
VSVVGVFLSSVSLVDGVREAPNLTDYASLGRREGRHPGTMQVHTRVGGCVVLLNRRESSADRSRCRREAATSDARRRRLSFGLSRALAAHCRIAMLKSITRPRAIVKVSDLCDTSGVANAIFAPRTLRALSSSAISAQLEILSGRKHCRTHQVVYCRCMYVCDRTRIAMERGSVATRSSATQPGRACPPR